MAAADHDRAVGPAAREVAAVSTVVLTQNEKDTLSNATAKVDLEHTLRQACPDLAGLQEWNACRDAVLDDISATFGLAWTRGPRGGSPALWRVTRYKHRRTRSVRLALPEFVGHLPGRRSRLGASWATEVILDDLAQFNTTVLLVCHLTAEIQMGAGYRTDLAHRLRVMRHKREKRRLGRRARMHLARGRKVYVVGDTNYDGFKLGRFVNCWDRRPGGSLGSRAVDVVLTDKPAISVKTIATHSDHHAVAVTYR